jgi:hypothetical protein
MMLTHFYAGYFTVTDVRNDQHQHQLIVDNSVMEENHFHIPLLA